MADFDRESMLEMFVFEMSQLLSNLESTVLDAESGFTIGDINEIFRIMHTIKGSAAMMLYENVSNVAHKIEDLFFYLREEQPEEFDSSSVADVVLEGMDFIKVELEKIENGEEVDGVPDDIIDSIVKVLDNIKNGDNTISETQDKNKTSTTKVNISNKYLDINQIPINSNFSTYSIKFNFEEDAVMKNVRAYTVASNLQGSTEDVSHYPEDLLEEDAEELIEKNGFFVQFLSQFDFQSVLRMISKNTNLLSMNLVMVKPTTEKKDFDNFNIFKCDVTFNDNYGTGFKNVTDFIMLVENHYSALEIKEIKLLNPPEDENSPVEMFLYTNQNIATIEELIKNTDTVSSLSLEVASKEDAKFHVEEDYVEEAEEAVEPVKDIEVPENIAIPEPEAIKAHVPEKKQTKKKMDAKEDKTKKGNSSQVISVNVSKLDELLNLMRELVITEAMVTQNQDLVGLDLENFHKDARQLHKIIDDVQDIVMSMRMVPLSNVFFKMHRIVRDMSKALNKDVQLEIIGEETEVDKNIIEQISDPLMHMIRNSIDHGLESDEERKVLGKHEKGTVTLEAKNAGGDVLIIIRDNGAGINREKVMEKARKNGLLKKEVHEYTNKEIDNFIFLPGFSTNEQVTNYSGRGVGMDVVNTNIESIGGSVDVESVPGEGSRFTIKIPLTLAIIDGMNIKIGNTLFTIPITSIKRTFKARKENLTVDPDGNEMLNIRGEVFEVIRISDFFNIDSNAKELEDGIILLIENGDKSICILADQLIGEHQVVVKTLPNYIDKVRGLSGCTLLGNGDISLIIDVAGFFDLG